MRIDPSFIKEMTLPETTSKLEHLFADNKVFFAWLVNPVNIESIEDYTVSTIANAWYTFYTVPSGSVVDIVSMAVLENNGNDILEIRLYKANGDYLPIWYPLGSGAGANVPSVALPAINIRGLEEGDYISVHVGGAAGDTTTAWFGIRDTLKSEY